MRKILLLLICIALASAEAVSAQQDASAPAPGIHQSLANRTGARASVPVVTTAAAASGQEGYVHFFLLQWPDESFEMLVGIELADQRIAWSFPGLGVTVAPFIAADALAANGKLFNVRHLYGIRPFPDDESMRGLRAELTRRVVPWIDDAIAYCDLRPAAGELCVSCLGFVMRILFPGPTPMAPALPPDFRRVGPDTYYTTEDLLLYLLGLHGMATREARLKRISELALPDNLREEAVWLVNASDPAAEIAVADSAVPPRSITGRPRSRVQSLSRTRQQAPRPNKNL